MSDPTPEVVESLQAQVARGRASDQVRAAYADYIQARKNELMRELGNYATDSTVADAVIRATAGRLKEILRWEQDLLRDKVQGEKAASWLDNMLSKSRLNSQKFSKLFQSLIKGK